MKSNHAARLENVWEQLNILDQSIRDTTEPLPQMAAQLAELTAISDSVASIKTVLQSRIGESMQQSGQTKTVIPGVGYIEGTLARPSPTYDREAVAREVIHRAKTVAKVDRLTGEIMDPADAVADAITKAFRLEPRSTALLQMGIELSSYEKDRPDKDMRPNWRIKITPERNQ